VHYGYQLAPSFSPNEHQPSSTPNVLKKVESYTQITNRYPAEAPNQSTINNTSNNAFTHLRNEISNLRSEFSKLVQKNNKQAEETDSIEVKEREPR
jgi:hypothetical protein